MPKRPRVLALGFFDGVHPAHLRVLHAARDMAKARGIAAAAVTFDAHPAAALRGMPPELLQSLSERQRLLREDGGMDEVIVLPFADWQSRSPEAFLRYLREELCAEAVSAGYDFRFGCGAAGDTAMLCQAFGGNAAILPRMDGENGAPIGASAIRALLREGKPAEAAAMMGRPFAFAGEVLHGKSLGHTLGFPTLNIPIPAELVRPAAGVYVSRAVIGGEIYGGVTNVWESGLSETFVFDYCADTYGQTVEIRLLAYLRPMRRFPGWDALAAQVEEDKANARAKLSHLQ